MISDFTLSKRSTFGSLVSIAENIEGMCLQAISRQPDRTFSVGKEGNRVFLCHNDWRIVFDETLLDGFDIVPMENGGQRFFVATFSFRANSALHRYGVIVSPESERDWLRDVAAQIGTIIGVPLTELEL